MINSNSFNSKKYSLYIFLFFLPFFIGILDIKLVQAVPSMKIPEDIKASVRQRIDNGYNIGVIVGIIDLNGTEYYSYGLTALSNGQQINENTIFEIGSVTKVFTAYLLTDMVEQGQLSLDDPIAKFLPPDINVPTYKGKTINLVHLATHTSGLPRLPWNIGTFDLNNPYENYNPQKMYKFLSDYNLEHGPGEKYEYSNYGMGLLGHLLCLRSGLKFEELIEKRITEKLGMVDTSINIKLDKKGRLAKGYSGTTEANNWEFTSLSGAGALRSTSQDMLKFLAANIIDKTSIYHILERTQKPYCNVGENLQIGLGWQIAHIKDYHIFWHSGCTGGYFCFIGFEKNRKIGIVVLTNSQQTIEDIGLHFLSPNIPLNDYKKPKKSMEVIELTLLPGEKLPLSKEIVEQYIHQIGGYKALNKVQNRTTKATLKMKMSGMEISGTAVTYQSRPNKFYSKIEFPGLYTIEQGYDGSVLWELSSVTGPRIISGTEKDDMLATYNFDIAAYNEIYKTVICVGKAEVDGQICYKLLFTPISNGSTITQYFSSQSGLSIRTEYQIRQPTNTVNVKNSSFNFKIVDGILYPHHTCEETMNVIVDTYFNVIEHNTKIPLSRFEVPDEIGKIKSK